MSRTIFRQLIGHEDFSLGQGKINQERGDRTISIRQIELEFIFRTIVEIRELNYLLYAHIALHVVGAVVQYYFDATSVAVDDGNLVLKPNTLLSTQQGRYLKVLPSDIFDTIICSQSDQKTPLVVDLVEPTNTFRASYALDLTNGHIRISVNTAPTGAKLIIDVHMNGTTIFSTLLSIDTGEKTSVTASVPAILSTTNVPDDAEFEVFVTQIGSTIAGTGLKVAVTGVKV